MDCDGPNFNFLPGHDAQFPVGMVRKKPPSHLLLSQQASGVQAKRYCKTSNINGTLEGHKIVDYSDVVGASPVGTAPTTSSFST